MLYCFAQGETVPLSVLAGCIGVVGDQACNPAFTRYRSSLCAGFRSLADVNLVYIRHICGGSWTPVPITIQSITQNMDYSLEQTLRWIKLSLLPQRPQQHSQLVSTKDSQRRESLTF